VSFTDETLDMLLDLTQGYPYFLQEWGYHVWNASPKSPITLDDVRLAARMCSANSTGTSSWFAWTG
jgi:hypothetical protein